MPPPEQKPRPLVLGVGNALRGDDAIGAEAIARLRAKAPEDLDLLALPGEAAALMEAWSGRERVYLIDASLSEAESGTVRRLDASAEDLPSDFLHCSTHSFGLAEAIALSRAMGELPPTVIVFAVEGASFEAGDALTPEASDGVDRVVAALLKELNEASAASARDRGE